MKILWLVNIELREAGDSIEVSGGWLSGMLSALTEFYPDTEIYIMYPQNKTPEIEHRSGKGFRIVGYYRGSKATVYNPELKGVYKDIIKGITPDVIHIMGTEYPHTLSMCEACRDLNMLDRMVVSIQGMPGPISKAYCLGLPSSVIYGCRLKDIIYGNVNKDRKRFEIAARYEEEALSLARNIIGRTEWDESCSKRINREAKYWHNNEVLRKSFYTNAWEYDKCEPNTVFVSQGNYPIKGLHVLIEGAKVLKENGFDVRYRIAGENIFSKPKWKWGKYTKYIYDRLKQYNLIEQFDFLGKLDEKRMVEEYLRANIFVLPSLIENSPNSLGEAMILGMPVISSDVGGIKDFINHGENGFIFPLSEPYMMAYYSAKYFKDGENAIKIGKRARETAGKLYDRKKNATDLMDIYRKISSGG